MNIKIDKPLKIKPYLWDQKYKEHQDQAPRVLGTKIVSKNHPIQLHSDILYQTATELD